MRMTAFEIARLTGGRAMGPDVDVDGASIDSRHVRPGQLFVPLVAERDGHAFIADALAAGAAAYLCSGPPSGGTAIVVEDTAAALAALGAAARGRLPDRVVGITGSVGKTTTKDLLAPVLGRRWRTAANPGSFNNELGVPLTLLGAPEGTEAVVIEMGARGIGHIASLVGLARPTVGVVTTVGVCHTEQFGTVEQVARSKAELVAGLPASGTAVLNAGIPLVAAMAKATSARVLTFGGPPDDGARPVDVTATAITLDGRLRPSFTLHSPWGDADVRLGVHGRHQVTNALAAAAAALACGVAVDDVAGGLAEGTLSKWRMALELAPSGALVINDAYNANPLSMEAALHSLATLDAVRYTAVLGVMAELGDHSAAEHIRVGQLAARLGIRVIAVGTSGYGGEKVDTAQDAAALLGSMGAGDAVLVKGSRAAGLETLAGRLTAAEGTAARVGPTASSQEV